MPPTESRANVPKHRGRPGAGATAQGILALVFWSTTLGLARSLREQLGVIAAPALIFLLSGALGTAYMAARGRLRRVKDMPRSYLFGCGGTFVAYMLFFYLALGLSPTRAQVLEVGVINYLWAGVTLGLSVPVLKYRARVWLIPGAMLAFAGVVLATAQGSGLSWGGFVANLGSNSLPYLLALGAGITWGVYSTVSRKWGADVESGAVPLFLLASGLAFACLAPFFEGGSGWSLGTVGELAYMVVFPATLAYTFWETAMRRGRVVLVAALSYLTPVAATLVTCVYLKVEAGATLWLACAMVVAGAVVCKLSVTEPGGSE